MFLFDHIASDSREVVRLGLCGWSEFTIRHEQVSQDRGLFQQRVVWDFLTTKSELDLFPKDLSWGGDLPSPGYAIPGKTKLI